MTNRSTLTLALSALTVVVTVLGSIYWFVVRRWFLRWGATDDELARDLPGDELVPGPAVDSTQVVTIDAPPETVWPWLVQIGQGRGGFYSYDWLEQLVGANIHNVNQILPEYQSLKEDDEVLLAPKDYWLGSPDSWPIVAGIKEPRYIVLRPPTDSPTYIWTFMLEPSSDSKTRFTARMRSPRKPTVGGRFIEDSLGNPFTSLCNERCYSELRSGSKSRVGKVPYYHPLVGEDGITMHELVGEIPAEQKWGYQEGQWNGNPDLSCQHIILTKGNRDWSPLDIADHKLETNS